MQAVIADVSAHVDAAARAPGQSREHEGVERLQFVELVAAENADLVRDVVADYSGQPAVAFAVEPVAT